MTLPVLPSPRNQDLPREDARSIGAAREDHCLDGRDLPSEMRVLLEYGYGQCDFDVWKWADRAYPEATG